jgi:hypothetical protein
METGTAPRITDHDHVAWWTRFMNERRIWPGFLVIFRGLSNTWPHTKCALGLGVIDHGLPIREIFVAAIWGHDSACIKVSKVRWREAHVRF